MLGNMPSANSFPQKISTTKQRKKSLSEFVQSSDYGNFLDAQIAHVLAAQRSKNEKMTRLEQLTLAIDYCKNYLREMPPTPSTPNVPQSPCAPLDNGSTDTRRRDVMAKIVELNLEVELLKEFESAQSCASSVRRVRGHDFVAQSASAGRNPYCEVCLSAIWRLAQAWRRCNVCGYRAHEKCLNEVRRPCVSLLLSRADAVAGVSSTTAEDMPPLLSLEICPETTLPEQNYKCDECHATIGFDEGSEAEPRLCDYTGRYFCRRCHWNDEMVIPARIVHNWDSMRRPVCRASKQLLAALERRPLVDLNAVNPALFRYVDALQRISELRRAILFMKCYFVSCKVARKLRILQYLNRYQHFVDTDTMYTMEDLIKLANGKLVSEIETIVDIFRSHITKDCEICQGNAFICELCDAKGPIYPFNAGVALCAECGCCFHRVCYERVSRRCSRCARRRARASSSASSSMGIGHEAHNKIDDRKKDTEDENQNHRRVKND